MKHLDTLKTVHRALGGLAILGALIVWAVGWWIGTLPDTEAWSIGLVIVAGFLSLGFGFLFFVSANNVARGEGRTLATVLAALQIGNCPGIFVAIYTLWVCWINEETKAVFEGAGSTAGTPPAAADSPPSVEPGQQL
jgi:hypothetical protein